MKWVKERDQLIAQTMAFVQSVTGKKPEATTRIETAPVDIFQILGPSQQVQPPVEAVVPPRKPSVVGSAIREEMEGRLAAFRAHQQRFDRERDRHFKSVLTGIHAAITDPPKTPLP